MSRRALLSGVQAEYLRLIYRRGTVADSVAALNERYALALTERQIRSWAKRHGWRARGRQRRRDGLLDAEQEQYLRDIWPGGSRAQSAAALNERYGLALELSQIITYARNHGIRGAPGGRFLPGHKSNLGMKRPGFRSPTTFRAGNVPRNSRPLWSERVSGGRALIKVPEINPHTGAATRFVDKARWVWAQKYGPIPAGCAVTFLDGDPAHCRPANLVLLTRAELAALNRVSAPGWAGPEAQPARLALARLHAATGQRARAKIPGGGVA